ncbi:hypothetical protein EW146_g3032 [Bondarzewia mesenterica]|uniref:Nucleotide exchange factor SIL1 n=1 Tax=Bondarzewia mesenterica TaxID=1095465 RepID=A0A4S4LYV4_9AGAM|nr:hypothetical protein EW146_g3032 [Bondarzewia mesenterica]
MYLAVVFSILLAIGASAAPTPAPSLDSKSPDLAQILDLGHLSVVGNALVPIIYGGTPEDISRSSSAKRNVNASAPQADSDAEGSVHNALNPEAVSALPALGDIGNPLVSLIDIQNPRVRRDGLADILNGLSGAKSLQEIGSPFPHLLGIITRELHAIENSPMLKRSELADVLISALARRVSEELI